jgi:gephyrin
LHISLQVRLPRLSFNLLSYQSFCLDNTICEGAPVPEGADAVLLVERTEAVAGEPGKVRLLESVKAGEAVRPIGFDIAAGSTVLTAGERLGAAEIGLLASLGIVNVPVYRRPIVGVLSTGNELVEAKCVPGSGQIRDSNRPMLLAAISKADGHGEDFGMAPDTPDALEAAIKQCLDRSDICVMSGGVSMGALDLLKPILSKLGTVHFGRLLMKPGMLCHDQAFNVVILPCANHLLSTGWGLLA